MSGHRHLARRIQIWSAVGPTGKGSAGGLDRLSPSRMRRPVHPDGRRHQVFSWSFVRRRAHGSRARLVHPLIGAAIRPGR